MIHELHFIITTYFHMSNSISAKKMASPSIFFTFSANMIHLDSGCSAVVRFFGRWESIEVRAVDVLPCSIGSQNDEDDVKWCLLLRFVEFIELALAPFAVDPGFLSSAAAAVVVQQCTSSHCYYVCFYWKFWKFLV